jgi:hypothetical protein
MCHHERVQVPAQSSVRNLLCAIGMWITITLHETEKLLHKHINLRSEPRDAPPFVRAGKQMTSCSGDVSSALHIRCAVAHEIRRLNEARIE